MSPNSEQRSLDKSGHNEKKGASSPFELIKKFAPNSAERKGGTKTRTSGWKTGGMQGKEKGLVDAEGGHFKKPTETTKIFHEYCRQGRKAGH